MPHVSLYSTNLPFVGNEPRVRVVVPCSDRYHCKVAVAVLANRLYFWHRRTFAQSQAQKAVGAGQFGQVWLASKQTSVDGGAMMVAVKLQKGSASDDDKLEFLRECEMTFELKHPNLVGLDSVALQQRPWLCVLEFLQYGDLKGILEGLDEKGVNVTEAEKLSFCNQIAGGMAFMASKKMIHMDLALRNVLVTTKSRCKVADFGLTHYVDDKTGTYVLTQKMKLPVKWMSIEAMDARIFSEGSDVWAWGIVAWEIYTYGALPYQGSNNADTQKEVRAGRRLEQPDEAGDDIYDLMLRSWEKTRGDRPTFSGIK